jgi:arylsulfatase A-like enzyme
MMKLRHVTAGLLMLCGSAEIFADNRPNILFVFTDDQRYDAMSVVQREQGERARFPWLETPNMDRLAAEGIRFRNAFVVNSLCSPSRAVNLTGRYNHLNGIASNFRDFPTDNVTYATLLRDAGYATAYIGKWHMGSQKERPGFDYAASFIGHSRYFNPEFIVQGKKVPHTGWIDDITTDYAIDYLESRKGSKQPWLMTVGFKTPHGPFEPPPRTQQHYQNARARVVPNFNAPAPYANEKFKQSVAGRELGETTRTNLGYFRCLTAADQCLGRLLEAVDQNGFRDNTVVIYTSDNGFYLGEHGLGDKRSDYEESLRVPFIVRYPPLGDAASGRTCDRMVLNLDLLRSLLDFAEVEPPNQIQGRSWKPLLVGDVEDFRKSWFFEYFAEAQRGSRIPDIYGVRTENSKLVVYPGHPEWTEMFDLAKDPYEINNLYNNAEHAAMRSGLEKELERLLREVEYVVPEYTDRPYWWGLPGGADWKPDATPHLKLEILPAGLNGRMVTSSVNRDERAEVKNRVKVVDTGDRLQAFDFSGGGFIEVGKPASIDPSMKAFTLEVAANIDGSGKGVLVGSGGASLGYCLAVKQGRVLFVVNAGNRPVVLKTAKPLKGWINISAILCADKSVELLVNGRRVQRKHVAAFITKVPNDTMQIGADKGSPVLEEPLGQFKGLIRSVRFYSGEKR